MSKTNVVRLLDAFLLLASFARASPALITPAPVLPRAVDSTLPADLIGYTFESGDWAPWSCRESSAFDLSASFGRCCASTSSDCFKATTCVDGSVMVNEDTSSTCSGTAAQTSCVAGTVYHTIGDRDPVMNYQCWPEWNGGNWDATVYTTLEPSSTSSSSESSSSSSSDSPSSETSPSASGSEDPAAPSAANTTLAFLSNPKQESKAWVAGPVIGSIAGAIIFTNLGIWLYRRRLRKQAQNFNPLIAGESGKEYSTQYAYAAGDGNGGIPLQQTPAELSSNAVFEVPGDQPKGAVEADGRPVHYDGSKTTKFT